MAFFSSVFTMFRYLQLNSSTKSRQAAQQHELDTASYLFKKKISVTLFLEYLYIIIILPTAPRYFINPTAVLQLPMKLLSS